VRWISSLIEAGIKVLFDRTVRVDAIIAWRGYVYADAEVMSRRYRYLKQHTENRRRRDDWKQQEIEALPQITRFIHEGRIIAYSSPELDLEAFRVEELGGPVPEDIFEGCKFHSVKAPLDRAKWGLSTQQVINKQAIIDYCKCFFLSSDSTRVERFIEGMRRNPRYHLTEFEEKCLRRAHVLMDICSGIEETHFPDALHLWTAEENGLDVFLTHDKRFKNVIERKRNLKFHCRVMLPTQLVDELQNS
jgi:hypothetical protein